MKFLLPFILILMGIGSYGQNNYKYGQFNMVRFTRDQYGGGVQSWDIVEANDHSIYVANNGGILEFNGEKWTKFEMENFEHPRSLAKNDAGQIFIGGQNEFGVVAHDEMGRTYADKISDAVDSINFNDIWKINCIGDVTYFMAREYIFRYENGDIEAVQVPNHLIIVTSTIINGELIMTMRSQEDYKSIYILKDGAFQTVKNSEGIRVYKTVMINNDEYIISEDGKFYGLESVGDNYMVVDIASRKLDLKPDFNIKSIAISNDMIVAGSKGQGVEIFDYQGRLIRTFGYKDGLEDMITHSCMFDHYNNLWLCNDDAIVFIEMSSAITTFNDNLGVPSGVTEDLAFVDDQICLATHADLQVSEHLRGIMQFKTQSVAGYEIYQIRDFTFSDGKEYLMIIGNDGIFAVDKKFQGGMVAKFVYAWDLFQSPKDPDLILVGLDGNGIGSIRYDKGQFNFNGSFKNTEGDVRSIISYHDQIYYSVRNKGIHLLDTTKQQSENLLTGLIEYEDETSNYEQFMLTTFKDKIYAGTAHGLYEVEGDHLIPSPLLDGKFNEEKLLVHRLINDNDEKLWLIMFHMSDTDQEEAEVGYLTVENGEYKWVSAEFSQLEDDVIFTIKKDKEGIYWMGGINNVYAYNERFNTEYDKPFSARVYAVYLNEDQEYLFNPDYVTSKDHNIDYVNNTIKFEFTTDAYLGGFQNEYSYYLEGEESGWSKWKTTNYVEFQRLSEGDYTFHLKARNFYGYESEETTFSFSILPPWYRTWWAFLIYAILVILLIYVIIRLSIRRVKAQNERLEQIVEERTAEIADQNKQLEHQKAEIEEKTNDILDSIKYAERIQTAILPTDESLNKVFDGDHFVLYKPKDIVSGDFYWADRFDSEAIFAAVDCTGHGVPGAFVSIVGFNGLNRTVNEFNLRKPGEILDKLAELVIGTFAKSESQIKDGMDIALCNINYATQKLTFAGANNPLVIVRNGEILEFKANKQPIGEFQNRVPFNTHEIDLQKGDLIYVFSDGYADQFGGDKGKKFKGKALKELLLEISKFEMKEQHRKLNEAFESWKGGFEQLDDVCLFGVKI
ncbi:MAG: SpoIIE family protein phosphatase [Crocinitomicaceae bacterium]